MDSLFLPFDYSGNIEKRNKKFEWCRRDVRHRVRRHILHMNEHGADARGRELPHQMYATGSNGRMRKKSLKKPCGGGGLKKNFHVLPTMSFHRWFIQWMVYQVVEDPIAHHLRPILFSSGFKDCGYVLRISDNI